MSIELKVKSKHLGEEARIIRFEERKQLKQYEWAKRKHHAAGSNEEYRHWNDEAFKCYCSLNQHRRWDVRNENRATFLARAYIAGKPYISIEHKRKLENEHKFITFVLPRVVAMVAKYGKVKTPLKIYDRYKGAYIDNPALVPIAAAIKEWSTIN